MALRESQSTVVTGLGVSQALAWASSYYLPAILGDPIAHGIGVSHQWVFGAFSLSLLITALAGPVVGRMIDHYGGRGVLSLSSLVLAGGLVLLAATTGLTSLLIAWVVLGVGMALGLYDAGFAALTALYGSKARGPITGITIIGGFSATIGWPISSLMNAAVGWRETCLCWAALNVVIGLPLNCFLLPQATRPMHFEVAAGRVGWKPYEKMVPLAVAFAAVWFVAGAMGAHLPTLLEKAGATAPEAIAAAALMGPAQVAARLAEFLLLRRVHPVVSARVATVLHPIGAGALAVVGPVASPIFVLLFGAGNGLLTVARGAVPLALFGAGRYGERSALIGIPARAAQASAPFLFGVLIDDIGARATFVSAGICLFAFVALSYLHIPSAGDTA